MKTICIISDTHKILHPKVLACLYGCDHIFHAGDIGDNSILDELKEIAPVTAVLGNCDDAFLFRNIPRTITSEVIEGVVFAVVHRPTQLMRDLPDVCSYYKSKMGSDTRIVGVHGHTHIPEIKTGVSAKPADFVICSGSVTSPRSSCAAFCEIVVDDGDILKCEIMTLEGEVLQGIDD